MHDLPAICETRVGRFTPAKLVAVGAVTQLLISGALWQLSFITLTSIVIASREHAVVGVTFLAAAVVYVLIGFTAVRRRSWFLAAAFCGISVLALPWPLLAVLMFPHPD
jgi:hypothetical protein